jgi:hypothetical protein
MMGDNLRRREFLKRVGAGVVGGALAPALLADDRGATGTAPSALAGNRAPTTTAPSVGTIDDLPTRKLGRIGIEVPILSLGTAPLGQGIYPAEPFEQVLEAAIDAGIRYLDTARIYDVAEERIAPVLARRRERLFLVTKSWAPTRDAALK